MTTTPSSNRLKLTPSGSPFLTTRRPRSPLRGRPVFESRLSLKRVVGTTCRSPTTFDTVNSSFAYTAGGAVVVVTVDGEQYTQRFYRARPNVIPLCSVAAASQNAPSTPPTTTTTPKANDSRNRVAVGHRDSHSGSDWSDGPAPRTWTSRERIKAATCLSLSPDGKYLAVGETGYAPRVLIFGLQDSSSDVPLVSISEHAFGVNAVAWSADSKYLASLGAANDGYLYVWKIDPRNGQARLFQQNRCTSYVKDMVWLGNSLITLGVRHIKMWRIDENAGISPTKPKFPLDHPPLSPTSQKTLPGRNIILGGLLEATFSCAAVDGGRLIICTEAGDVCVLEGDDKQMKVLCVVGLDFFISTIQIRGDVAYVGGKDGSFTRLDVVGLMDGRKDCVIGTSQNSAGLVALGFTAGGSVTVDAKGSIDIWDLDHVPDGRATAEPSFHIHIPGHREPVAGICPMDRPNEMRAAFLTWSYSGMVTFWDLDGQTKASVSVPLEGVNALDASLEPLNQLTCVKVSKSGRLLVTADRLGVLRVTDTVTKECLLDTKAHSADCTCISLYEDEGRFLMACCGRDRTAQLFHRTSSGNIEHFQTIEFAARVVQVLVPSDDKVITCSWDRTMQVHDLVTKEGEPDAIAAIPSKIVSLKASPTSMAASLDNRTMFVSMLDRSVCQYDLATGRPVNCFKCMDETGIESAVLESLSIEQGSPRDSDFLLAVSNTDKSIRLYDSISGVFLDREWGHTEAINGVCLVEGSDEGRRVVSVAADGTIMIWSLDVHERLGSREPSPARDATSGRPPLRKVLSKAELAEFQRPREGSTGQRSSPPPQPRTLRKRTSRLNLSSNPPGAKTPSGTLQVSPGSSRVMDDTPSRRRGMEAHNTSSPPLSPKARLSRRPSLPALSHSARKKNSTPNLRGNGSLNTATEQACRTLRAYRKKLSSAEPINPEALGELDQELRFTAAALGDRAVRSRAMNETVLSGLLDQYSERLVTLLDEKLRLTSQPIERDTEVSSEDRRGSTDETSSTTSSR
ncbi:wd repeat [Trichoderma cornu-damae]|uniref:Wd repeat n=1 Tax=Trichoderma cornu-damae TaxID=654480 RepID=A0A9P8QMU8_9HYPO|nr:wd repeat [Trichoderma cornu-damae]